MKPRLFLLTVLCLGAGLPIGYVSLRAHAPEMPEVPATAASAAESYDIDGVHSQVVFKANHLGVSYNYGRFNDVSGKFTWDAADPAKSSIEVTIKAESIDTGNGDRDNHLRGPDFFDAKQFPTISFKSTKVAKSGDGLKVTGDLSLHGKTKAITVDAKHVGSNDAGFGYRTGFDVAFTVKRSEYGMSEMLEMLGDEVMVMVGIEGVRK
ncbi:MAG: polyisoprenoid-binding protein [Planctomycetota bacterium]|nr:MAG: polyisoprenoid-binding protein [Planctomycetota bacterium]